jgi:hypothetical protein
MVHMSSRTSAQPRNMKQQKSTGANRAAVKAPAAGSAACLRIAALDRGDDPLGAFPFLKSIVAEN